MRILLGLFMLLGVTTASADIVFAPSISYMTEKSDDKTAPSTTEVKRAFYDFRLGYLHSSGLFLGGTYSMQKFSTGGTNLDGYSAGPTLGFSHYSGFYTFFTYFLLGEMDKTTSTKYTNAMGPQIDVGWAFPLTASFHLGPQITYRSISYDKLKGAGSVSYDYTYSGITPAVVLWFNF